MTRAVLRHRSVFLAVIVALTVILGTFAVRVDIERSNESMNARDESVLAAYDELRAQFGNDENLVVVLGGADILSSHGLTVLDRLSERIAALDGVASVASVTRFEQVVASRAGAAVVPLVARPFDRSQASADLAAALDRNPDLIGLLVSADRQSAAILVDLAYRNDDDHYRGAVIDAVRRIIEAVATSDGYSARLTGLAVQKYDVYRYVTRDQNVLIPAAVLVIAIVLWMFFRSIAGVLLPLCVTAISLIWTVGLYSALGLALNTITSLLPPVMMVLSVATTVHVYAAWLEHMRAGVDRRTAIAMTIERMKFPCAFTAITTVVGFASLAVSATPAVRLFGVFAAIGVLLAFALGMTLIPVLLSYEWVRAAPAGPHRAMWLDRLLDGAAALAITRPRTVVVVGALAALPAALALPQVHNNTDLVRFLRADAPLRRDTQWIARHFGPVVSVDAIVSRQDGEPLRGLADVRRLDEVAAAIGRLQGVESVVGPTDLLKQLERGETGSDELSLPEDEADLDYLFDLLDADPSSVAARFFSPDRSTARIRVGLADVGTATGAGIIAEIERTANERLGPAYRFEPTGSFYQVVVGSQGIVRSQVASFALALVLVVAAIGLEFRSPVIVVVAAVPNVLPIALVGGLMAWMHIDLSTGTAMIASVVLGLAVDDTIHYLARFRREYTGDAAEAVRRATRGVGRVLVMTSVVLILGFWVGALGSFMPTVHFSLLSGVTMLLALLYDLLVLPGCLLLAARHLTGWASRPRTVHRV